jgi:hypothetical protein
MALRINNRTPLLGILRTKLRKGPLLWRNQIIGPPVQWPNDWDAVQEHRVPTPRPGKTGSAFGPPFIPNIRFQKQRSCSLGSTCVRVQASGLLFLLQARGSPALWCPLRGGIDGGHIYWFHYSTRGYKRQTKKIRNRPLGVSMACHSYLHP